MMLNLNNGLSFILTLLVLTATPALAYKVKDISGKKVLVDLENEKLFVDDILISVDKTANGPQIMGSAKVLQIRQGMAVALIQEGKFVIGKKLARKASSSSQTTPTAPNKQKTRKTEAPLNDEDEIYETSEQRRERLLSIDEENIILRKDLIKVAVLLTLTQDRFTTKQAYDNPPFVEQETVVMSGNNFGFGLSVDYPYTKWGITFRGIFLTDRVAVSGRAQNNSCDGRTSTNCYANITYLSAGGLVRFDYHHQRMNYWAAVGTVFKFPTARNTSSLRHSDLQTANAVLTSFGLDYSLNNRFYVPVAYEYHHSLNTSETVPVIDHHAILFGFGFKIK